MKEIGANNAISNEKGHLSRFNYSDKTKKTLSVLQTAEIQKTEVGKQYSFS
jgi:hypothetical protein